MSVKKFIKVFEVFNPTSKSNTYSLYPLRHISKNIVGVELNVSAKSHHCDEYQVAHIEQFLSLMDADAIIRQFLDFDHCYQLADKYLLAIVFVYFIRAKLPLTQYNRLNFFIALHLAHDMEEEDEDLKDQIVLWGQRKFKKDQVPFLRLRNIFWKSMNYRAVVNLKCCEQVMASAPFSKLWLRERNPVHGGVIDPNNSARCPRCTQEKIQYYDTDLEEGESDSDDSSDEPPLKKAKFDLISEEWNFDSYEEARGHENSEE